MTETTAATAATDKLCRWEGCTRPAALRRGKTGPAPVYCLEADGHGPVHNPLNAWRARAAADAPAGPGAGSGRYQDRGQRPGPG